MLFAVASVAANSVEVNYGNCGTQRSVSYAPLL
jgi:hypothetical protein